MAIRSKLSATVSLSACAGALTGVATPAWAQDAASAADDVEQLRDQRFCGAAAIAWLQTAAALGPL